MARWGLYGRPRHTASLTIYGRIYAVRKSTFIVAFAASAALVAASTGTTFASASGHAVGNSGHAVTLKPTKHAPAAPASVNAFKAFAQPVAKYTSKSCDIDLSSLADFTPVNSVTDCGTTVSLSSTFEKRSVPNSWASWGSPPDTETDTPNILYSAGATSATVNFGKTVKWGGFEYEPDLFQVETVTVTFYKGANGTGKVRGTITRDVDGSFGARLFGGHSRRGWKSATISNNAGDDFAIAQVRV